MSSSLSYSLSLVTWFSITKRINPIPVYSLLHLYVCVGVTCVGAWMPIILMVMFLIKSPFSINLHVHLSGTVRISITIFDTFVSINVSLSRRPDQMRRKQKDGHG